MARSNPPTGTPATTPKECTFGRRNDWARLISCCMSLLATRKAVGLLISTLGFTKTGELTADSLTVKFPNCTAPRSNSIWASHRLSRDCSFMGGSHRLLYFSFYSSAREVHAFPFHYIIAHATS